MKLSKEIKVGVLATAALAIVYIGFNFLKSKAVFSSNNCYCTIYDTCSGLHTASPVLLNGTPVGRVRSIEILHNREHSVLVTFETKKDIKLTDTTKAQLMSTDILGTKAIGLIMAEGQSLKNYDTVPGEIEKSLGEIYTEGLLPALQEAKVVPLLISQFVANLIENTDRMNSIFYNLEGATRHLKQTIGHNQQEFNTLSRNLSDVSKALADSEDGVRPLLIRLNQLLEGIKGQEAKEFSEKLNNILGSVENILDNTGQGSSSLSRLLSDDSFYNNLNQTISNLDKLVVDLKAHPRRYVNFSVFGRRHCKETNKK